MKVMLDLRPCHHSYAGIPHDTRMLFKIISGIENINLTGHINSSNINTCNYSISLDEYNSIIKQSHFIALIEQMYTKSFIKKLMLYIVIIKNFISICIYKLKLFPISSYIFKDYIWRNFFAQSINKNELSIDKLNFEASSLPHQFAMLYNSLFRRICVIDTKKYDLYIGQPPFPFVINKQTKLILRWHDAVPITHVDTIKNKRIANRFFSDSLQLHKNDAYFVANSFYSKRKLLEIYPELEKRTYVAYCCVHEPSNLDKYIKIEYIINCYSNNKFDNKKPYILAVGTCEPRKNYELLLYGWRNYTFKYKNDAQLVIVANVGWESESTIKNILTYEKKLKNVFWLKNVKSDDLSTLYFNAKAVVISSFEEGFSYSGAEAMIHKTLVIASDIPVHREIYGEYAEFFSPYDHTELTSKIYKIMHMKDDEKDKRIEKAFQFCQRYTEVNCKEQWKKILNDIYNTSM